MYIFDLDFGAIVNMAWLLKAQGHQETWCWLCIIIHLCIAIHFSPNPLLTHWGRVMHICGNELTNIGSDNGLSPERHQAIIWNNVGLLLIEPLGTNFSEISIGIQTFSFKKMHLKMSSAKWRPFCLGLNALTYWSWDMAPNFKLKIWNLLSCMKIIVILHYEIHWNLFSRVQLKISHQDG